MEFSELSRLVGNLGITVHKATIQELVEDSSDSYFGLGRKAQRLAPPSYIYYIIMYINMLMQ